MKTSNHKNFVCLLLLSSVLAGCTTFGQQSLETTRHYYNEEVKTAAEQELLLNIVRLRYTDTPSSLSVSAIAAQYERSRTLGLTPFFTAAGGDINRSFTSILPQAEMTISDRPTFSLTPLDDQEFTRKLFTPIPLDGIVYLAKTTWPISTVFRLYLENLNWVSNAETASGPTPRSAPVYKDFMRGMQALQTLQDQGRLVFGIKENVEVIGGPLAAGTMKSQDMLEAAKSGYEYQQRDDHQWYLVKRTKEPVIRLDPAYLNSDEAILLRKVFKLKANLEEYPLTQEELSPFPAKYGAEGVDKIDLETRSLLQALYYVSHGIDIPAEHLEKGLARETLDDGGKPFNWNQLTNGLFKVLSSRTPPTLAHVAIQYKGYWYYIAENDIETKSTFSLLMELSRLELTGKSTSPLLTLPVGGSR